MAHMKKFSKGSSTRIIEHCERIKDEKGNYRKYKTGSDIDDTKTKENYPFRLKGHAASGKERLQEILDNTYCMNRSDVNVMADWVITLPKDYKGNQKKFFEACSKFVVDRYGKDSFVGGYVHNDESQPHIHLCFVPRVYDEKKGRYKVCAKEVINKKDLDTFHTDLETYLLDKGIVEKGQILSGVTKETGGNKTIPELKKLSEKVEKVKGLVKRLDEYIPDEDLNEISEILDEIDNEINESEKVKELAITPTVVKRREKVR